MSDLLGTHYTIQWMGYNEAPNYNRVWGYLTVLDGSIYAFWGKLGCKLRFKRHEFEHKINFLVQKQQRIGFKPIDPAHYALICKAAGSNFFEDLEICYTTARLSDQIR